MLRVAFLRPWLLLWLVSYLAACASIISDNRVDYEKATSLPTLEIPPDLVAPVADNELALPKINSRENTRYSDYATNNNAPTLSSSLVLPVQEDIRVIRAGNQRWLSATGTPDQIWQKVRAFWIAQGFPIKMEDPRTGILETDWLENRINIPKSAIRALFSKVIDKLYDSSTRDRFRVRLERGETTDKTEVYIAHMGAAEVVQGDSTVWQMRPNDPELEAVMLQRLVVFMGVKEDQAKTMLANNDTPTDRTRLVAEDGTSSLIVTEDFPRAWRHVGLALDQVGFTVEDRDRSSGIYYVRYHDSLQDSNNEKGFLAKLAFWRSNDPPSAANQYRIQLQDRGEQTIIIVQTQDGTRDSSPTGQRILTLLHERLR